MGNKLLKTLKENLENVCFDEESFLIEVNQYLNEYTLNLLIEENFSIIQDEENNNLFKVETELVGENEILIRDISIY